MSTYRLTLIIVIFYFFPYGCCNFSEIINIDEIIGNTTLLLPTFDDQIGPGKKCQFKIKRDFNIFNNEIHSKKKSLRYSSNCHESDEKFHWRCVVYRVNFSR